MSILKAKKSDGGWEEIHSVKAMTQSTNDFTQDATATANDMAEGVTAYVKGQKITGAVMQLDGTIGVTERTPYYNTIDGGQINMDVDLSGIRFISGDNFKLSVSAKASEFGDAATSDVLSGKTFTSANGLKLTGTYIPSTTTVNLQTKTVSPTTSKQIVKPDSGYTGLSQVTVNAMASGGLGTPSISVAANGVITATANVGAGGYLAAGTTKNNTLTLSSAYDSDFVASNIRSGKTIFGITGTYTGTSGVTLPTLSNPAEAIHVAKGKEVIDASGAKMTGSLPLLSEMEQANGIDSYSKGAYPDDAALWISDDGRAGLYRVIDEACYCNGRTLIGTSINAEALGDATAADVVNGKTFTSKNGVKVAGTFSVNQSYVKTNCNLTMSNNSLNMWTQNTAGATYAIANNGIVDLYCSGDKLGDAKPEDVVVGKTFTSSYGLKVAGTYTPPSIDAGIVGIKMGTLYNSSNSGDSFTVTHNLGVVPNFGILVAKDSNTLAPSNLYISSSQFGVLAHLQVNRPYTYSTISMPYLLSTTYATSSSNTGWENSSAQTGRCATTTTFTFEFAHIYSCLKAGVEYTWIVGVTKSPYIPGGA